MAQHLSTAQERRSGGFTLLEVLIALAILTVSLLILVSTQSSAARMTEQADRILIGTMLAKQKVAEVEMLIETEPGFSEQDVIEEDGDFDQAFPGIYPEYRWRTSIRKLDLSGASTGGLGDMLGMGDDASPAPGMPEQPDVASLINTDEITEQLSRYIREVKVTVYWMDGNEPDDVTLTTHVIKPNGPSLLSGDEEQAPGGAGGPVPGAGGPGSLGGGTP